MRKLFTIVSDVFCVALIACYVGCGHKNETNEISIKEVVIKASSYDEQLYEACCKWADPKSLSEGWKSFGTCHEIATRCMSHNSCETLYNGFRTNTTIAERNSASEALDDIHAEIKAEKARKSYIPPYQK
jgi:hypothetical protein